MSKRQRFCLRRSEVHNENAVPSERKYCAQERTGRLTPVSQTITGKHEVLLMDEMTSGLDERSGRRMMALLRQQLPRTALVLVSHQTYMRSLADTVIELNPNGENHG